MRLKQKSILILSADLYEDLELQYPKYRMLEEGAKVIVASYKKSETIKGKYGYPCSVDSSFEEIRPEEFDALIIPGGYAPDKLRMDNYVLDIVKRFDQDKKVIAFICHGGWVPISAKVLKGIKCTSYQAIKDDMMNAGANWVDEPVVIDHHFISSRYPNDLPIFCLSIIDHLARK